MRPIYFRISVARTSCALLLVMMGTACRTSTTPAPCPATTVTLTVTYKRDPSAVKVDSINVPVIAENDFNGGPTHTTTMTRVDYLTWTATITVPTNLNQQAHQIHIGDAALTTGTAITASDIYLNGVHVSKGKSPSGENEYGFFHVDGCGNIT